jgi:TDG/mug DNA glycosylase family protein
VALTSSHRPTPAELAAATERTIPDVIAPDLDVLFVGINPGLYSGATGFHFARPGNRFWKAIYGAGFTQRVLDPSEQGELLRAGIGITNLVARTTATAAELSPDELRTGARILIGKVERWKPRSVAFLGISTYRVGFQKPTATIGRQPIRLADAAVWLLPNPSGLNASWQLPRLVDAYQELRENPAD